MYLQIAWRNIWRNPRRTAVILTAVVIGVWIMVFLGALMYGVTDQMIKNSIATLTGNIQIHHPEYRNDPVIENTMAIQEDQQEDQQEKLITSLEKNLPPGSLWTSRIRVNAVASNARHSSGITLVGIEPDKEAEVSFIAQGIVQGKYLQPDDKHGIIIGRAFADKFETKLGHKLVLMSQAADREMASRAFRIVGIYRADLEATEKAFAFVNMPSARKMLKLETGLSEISVIIPENIDEEIVAQSLKKALPDSYSIETWKELLPLITAYVEMNKGFSIMWNFVVFIAMGFGIVNTMLMAVFERMREFGLLKALGMKPWWIIIEVLTESLFILILGILIGNAVSLASVLALSETGINLSAFAAAMEYTGMPRIIFPVIQIDQVILANLVVLVLGLIVSIYPAVKAAGFTPVEAMSHY
ncbi:ABC transporter permease [Desulfobacterales bacterium HSG17]|nr:ABC transporter permease [Desulfobacterales bacterium HSG17]